ncbi:cell wall hydrolase [[Pseudomonas] carboxydohydrogena]|nr:cell wall hydrolase [[Pseudomonas] carboxydohydrogena]
MVMLRDRLKGANFAPFSFVLCLLAMTPTEIGYQDIASQLAHQAGVAQRWQQHLFATPRNALRIASFNFVRPIGTDVPDAASVTLVSLGGRNSDITGSLGGGNPFAPAVRPLQASDYPVVMRAAKGDRLPMAVPPAHSVSPASQNVPAEDAKAAVGNTAASEPLDQELQEALNSPRLPQYDAPKTDDGVLDDSALAALHATSSHAVAPRDPFTVKTASLFFGSTALGDTGETLERWQPGEEPVVILPSGDPDLKQHVSLSPNADPSAGGESIAPKGEVNTESPAQRLHLDAHARAKGEKCLAEAVYFEARGEAVRGQIAVAQVVMNRVFSGFYPTTICGVVYQNKGRHLACQFTFACDNVRDVINEPDMWERAKRIAKATLDGKLWLPEVGKSTHYHAYWVRPSWVHEMKKMYRFGVHTFYRPKAWGDGKDAPSWGNAAQTAEISKELVAEAKSSAELEAKR